MHHPSKNAWLPELPSGQQSHYQAQSIISRPSNTDDQFFLIEEGQARIFLCAEDGKELTLGYLKPQSIYVTHTRAWIEAMTDTTTTSWHLRQLTALLATKPDIAVSAMQEIGVILRNAIDIIENLAFRSVESRLARYLLVEYRQQNQTTIQLSGNTEILASLLGTSRQTLSTILNQLLKKGAIQRVDRQHLTLIDLPYLQQLAEVNVS